MPRAPGLLRRLPESRLVGRLDLWLEADEVETFSIDDSLFRKRETCETAIWPASLAG